MNENEFAEEFHIIPQNDGRILRLKEDRDWGTAIHHNYRRVGAALLIVALVTLVTLAGCDTPAPESPKSSEQAKAAAVVEPEVEETEDAREMEVVGEREELLYGIAAGTVTMEEALNTVDGVVWVVNMESPNGDDNRDDLPLRRRLSPRGAQFGELLCGEDLEPFWQALQVTLKERFEVAEESDDFGPRCRDDYCTFLSLGEYFAFIRLEFDSQDRIRAGLFYTRDATIMDEVLEEFQERAFSLRDEALQDSCQ